MGIRIHCMLFWGGGGERSANITQQGLGLGPLDCASLTPHSWCSMVCLAAWTLVKDMMKLVSGTSKLLFWRLGLECSICNQGWQLARVKMSHHTRLEDVHDTASYSQITTQLHCICCRPLNNKLSTDLSNTGALIDSTNTCPLSRLFHNEEVTELSSI